MTDAGAPYTPNDGFRRIRRIYITCISAAIPLLVLALMASAWNIGYGVVPAVLLISGVALLVIATLARGGAVCPGCHSSIMWRKGPFGTGRLSIREKAHCPSCNLDLNAPWTPAAGEPGAANQESNR
ncbi:MAG: hypothetical protein AB7O57_01260 [Hyphomicrobiaceae bacterium]